MQNFNFQGFRFTGSDFKPCFGCFQFIYMSYEISASNMGVDTGACPTEVAVFSTIGNCKPIGYFHTVEEAITFINQIVKE